MNTLIAEKIATNIDSTPKMPASNSLHAGDEHVVAPGEEADERDAERRDARCASTRPGGLCAKVGTTSLITPIAGRIMM